MYAIDTKYMGYRFRSRLEARWAVFFETAQIEWRYEPEGFILDDGTPYLPDFLLPGVTLRGDPRPGIWVEIKGTLDPSGGAERRGYLLAKGSGLPVALLVGDVRNDDTCEDHFELSWLGHLDEPGPGWDNFMIFVKCYECGHVKYEFNESNYMRCPKCGGATDDRHPALRRAVSAARSARFEHGESPQPMAPR